MADASSHDKQMKYFMGAKLTVLRVAVIPAVSLQKK